MSKNKIIYGIHTIKEALDSGQEIEKLFVKRGLAHSEIKRIIEIARDRVIPIQMVPEEKLARLTRGNHQGIVGIISDITYYDLDQIIPQLYEEGKIPFFIILDGLTDVRNFGAIARTAECVGADAIIIPHKGSVGVTSDAIKTSVGALMRIPVCRVKSLIETIKTLQLSGIKVCVASEKATTIYTEEDYNLPMALVMGAEDVGPSPEVIRIAERLIAIPQQGKIGSLNVSVATGIISYEVYRQRNQ